MTYDEYVDYYTSMVQVAKITDVESEAKDLAKHAIRQGLDAFWGAWDWYWKENQTTLAITASAEDYIIKDFESFRILREQATVSGLKLQYYAKEEFDTLVPKTSTFATGDPQMYTVYRDITDKKWRIAFFPQPDGAMTIYLSLYIEPGGDTKKAVELIPSRFLSGLEAFIGWKIYPVGDSRRMMAYTEVQAELKRLQIQNKLNMSSPNFMPDGTDQQVTVDRPWI